MLRPKIIAGFTLIELLVVIAIIGLLSSVILASLNSARLKAQDAQTQANFSSLYTALQLYYDKHGSFPVNENPCCGYPSTNSDWLSVLVTDGEIGSIPKPTSSNIVYDYYDYGKGSVGQNGQAIGALLVTNMISKPPSTTGYGGDCRPWNPNQNWCDTSSNTNYCICIPY